MRKTLLVDIDGVLAQYDGNYKHGELGNPVHGAADAMARLQEKFKLTIYTTRELELFKKWAEEHGIPFDDYVQKPICFALLDDRAIRFNGDWQRAVDEVENFKPWWKD